jgi:hypothetical protein
MICPRSQVARASMVTPPEEPSLKDDKRQCVIQEEATWVRHLPQHAWVARLLYQVVRSVSIECLNRDPCGPPCAGHRPHWPARAQHRRPLRTQGGLGHGCQGVHHGYRCVSPRPCPCPSLIPPRAALAPAHPRHRHAGIRYTHVEFGGFDDSRAIFGYDATASDDGFDRNGHGTHVAGSVGATLYGIAKGVTLVSVKVLGDNGSGSFAGVIAGIDWSAGDSDGADTSNMSLGGGLSTAVNDAVNAAVLNGA